MIRIRRIRISNIDSYICTFPGAGGACNYIVKPELNNFCSGTLLKGIVSRDFLPPFLFEPIQAPDKQA